MSLSLPAPLPSSSPSSFWSWRVLRRGRVPILLLGSLCGAALLASIAAGHGAGRPAVSPAHASARALKEPLSAPDIALQTLASGLPGLTSIVSAGDDRLFLTE